MRTRFPLAALYRLALTGAALLPTAVAAQDGPADNPLHQAVGAPDNLKLSGSFRVRLEGIDDQFRPAPTARSDAFLSFRTTVFAEYDARVVRIGAELFDSRGYLEKSSSSVGTSEINAVELGQAYVAADLEAAGGTASVTAGRFTLDIGSRRLVARNQFRNTINAFTGVQLDWRDAAADRVRLFWTMPQQRLPDEPDRIRDNAVEWDRESTDLTFFGASATKAAVLGGTLELYGYGLVERDAPGVQTRDRHLFTPGVRLARSAKPGRLDYDLEATYQTGHARATTMASDVRDLSVSAWFLHAELGHGFAGAWSPRLALQYDRGSGDSSDPDGYTRFDTLFGSRRADFGPTSLYGPVQRSNLSAPGVRLEVSPDKRLDGALAYRALWLVEATDSFAATGVRDRTGASGRFAGQQVEARARYWLVPRLARLEGGIAYLAKGRFLRDAPNAPATGDTRYGYLDLTLTF